MSIVAEILQSATKVDVDDINKKVPELKRTVEKLTNNVITDVENIYVKYKYRHKMNNALLNEALQCQHTLNALKEKAEFIVNKDLTKTDRDLNINIKELEVVDFKMNVLLNIQNTLKLIDTFKKELVLCDYVKCVNILKDLNETVKKIPSNECLEIIDELKFTIQTMETTLLTDLKNIFTSNIDLIQMPENRTTTLKIKKPNEEMKTVISAYYINTGHVYPLNRLAGDIWKYIFVPIVSHELVLAEKEDSTFVYLNLTMKTTDKKSDYQIVFKNLETVLQFLSRNFNYNLSNDLTALEYIGNDIRDNLSELIIKNCLRDTIPSKAEELQNYKVVIEATKNLEKSLLDAHIFTSQTVSIFEYASNIDVLFINKKCGEYLERASEIMKKDLHDIIEVGVPYNPEYPLGQEHLAFPQCSISKNVQELLNFCEGILQKAIGASPECSGRLFVTVTKILLKYRTFVPEFHRAYLATLPQQIAIFLNNCRYISYTLVQWNTKYCGHLKQVLVSCDFTAEAAQFPIIGYEMFSRYIESQVTQINEIMEGAQLDGPTLDKLDPKTEKCIRQCLRQQELLRTVWHKVLPYEVYNKNIGLIINALCKNIITSIVKFEDIPAKVAEDLVDVIKLVLTRAPKLFINPNEVTLYVPLWYKLSELSFVLNVGLADINDRWADGKGPLALQFEPEELKQLIKALFQNTDRRAAVIAKISDFNIKP